MEEGDHSQEMTIMTLKTQAYPRHLGDVPFLVAAPNRVIITDHLERHLMLQSEH